jgi:hypothetical protein
MPVVKGGVARSTTADRRVAAPMRPIEPLEPLVVELAVVVIDRVVSTAISRTS